MKIEIFDSHVEQRQVGGRDGHPPRIFYDQEAYAHLGGRFPSQFRLSHREFKNIYKPGQYKLAASSYRIGRYGDIELNPYELKLVPLNMDETTGEIHTAPPSEEKKTPNTSGFINGGIKSPLKTA